MNIAMHFPTRTPVPQAAATTPLPSGSVAMLPGFYVFNGVGYDCRLPGKYQFWNGGASAIQTRFVYWDGAVNVHPDLYTFMAAISGHHTHEDEDETANYQALANNGRTRKWKLRCGFIAGLVQWWLPQYGLQVQTVNVVTQQAPNGVDDGHILNNIFHGGKWKSFDMTNDCWYRKDGVHLSVAEVVAERNAAGNFSAIERVPLSGLDKNYSGYLSGIDFCMASYKDLTRITAAEDDAWFDRLFQSVV